MIDSSSYWKGDTARRSPAGSLAVFPSPRAPVQQQQQPQSQHGTSDASDYSSGHSDNGSNATAGSDYIRPEVTSYCVRRRPLIGSTERHRFVRRKTTTAAAAAASAASQQRHPQPTAGVERNTSGGVDHLFYPYGSASMSAARIPREAPCIRRRSQVAIDGLHNVCRLLGIYKCPSFIFFFFNT